MEEINLTINQQKTLFGLIAFPTSQDKDLAKVLDINESTLSAAKQRILEMKLLREVNVPIISKMGFELLGINFTNFIPGLGLDNRLKLTTKTFERNEEIFLSVGDHEKGFSLNFCQNYTRFVKINNDRTKIFGELNLLGRGHPHEIVFPFQTSRIYNFFNCAPIIQKKFQIPNLVAFNEFDDFFPWSTPVDFSEKEMTVFSKMIEYPNNNNKQIAAKAQAHRHTVSKLKQKLDEFGLMRKLYIPNLLRLGFKILVFYHFRYNARNPPQLEDLQATNTPNIIFFAHKTYESVLLAIYRDFHEYSQERSKIINHLEAKHIISEDKEIHEYNLENTKFIKQFQFHPLLDKTLHTSQNSDE